MGREENEEKGGASLPASFGGVRGSLGLLCEDVGRDIEALMLLLHPSLLLSVCLGSRNGCLGNKQRKDEGLPPTPGVNSNVNLGPLVMWTVHAQLQKQIPLLGLLLGAQLGICWEVSDLPLNFAVNMNYLKQ